MVKREAQFQTNFNRWAQYEFDGTAAFELKVGYASIPFDAVVEHQERALFLAKHGKIVFKIPDGGWQNPFDSFCLQGVEAYVVLLFTSINHDKKKNHNTREFFLIDIDTWINEKNTSTRKSLTEPRAREIGLVRRIGN